MLQMGNGGVDFSIENMSHFDNYENHVPWFNSDGPPKSIVSHFQIAESGDLSISRSGTQNLCPALTKLGLDLHVKKWMFVCVCVCALYFRSFSVTNFLGF